MKKLIIVLVLLTGCGAALYDYGTCLETVYPTPVCESYFIWVPGYWTIGGVWVDGFYRMRPGYHWRYYQGRTIIIDHRHGRHY